MKQSLMERFIWWICDTFGHKPDGKGWSHEGKHYMTCKRCLRFYQQEQSNE